MPRLYPNSSFAPWICNFHSYVNTCAKGESILTFLRECAVYVFFITFQYFSGHVYRSWQD